MFTLCALALGATTLPQDPVKSRPTSRPASGPSAGDPERPPLPPVEEEFQSRVERKDLLQRFGSSSPLEGFYGVRTIVRGGVFVRGGDVRGYVWFGRQHMSIHTAVSAAAAGDLFLQASVRRYRVDGDRITMTTLVGHEHAEDLGLETTGRIEVRRFKKTGTVLRVYRDAANYVELARIE